ncbi:cobalamin biosynthesis protein [Hydrogenophaga intermedia]|uniref:cobalamin biosynthesis protein n=1 Tax=Hydrogenophaga intermedia TaxID=65786 RepID=UPI002042FA4A|nr:cobalamin biosynthesis protein [Hydrogenophaga intermedia]MCM3564736.1 cobalamin biosynthesis protein [Hydrogenophaga intermedia]
MRVVAGLGFRHHTSCHALRQVLEQAVQSAQHDQHVPMLLQALATAQDKCDHPALAQLAAELGLPVASVPLAYVRAQSTQPSPHAPARYGFQSLAESAALAAAGQGAVLASRRHISADGTATAAIALYKPDHTAP